MAGVLPAGADAGLRTRARSTFVGNLRSACNEAQRHGISVLIEALNPRDMRSAQL